MPQERFSLLQTETTVIEREFMKGYTSTGVILHGLFFVHEKLCPVNTKIISMKRRNDDERNDYRKWKIRLCSR